jgi:hypothetical protein
LPLTNVKIDKVKQTLGFFSMTIAWSLMNIVYSIYLVAKDGRADDLGVVIFWSGLFMFIAWTIFIIYPLHKLNHSGQLFKPTVFPLISTLYGTVAYTIIVGGLFRNIQLLMMFLPLAILAGLIFGLSYSLLIKANNLIEFLNKRPIFKVVLILSPAIFIFFFFWALPMLAPAIVYQYMPDQIQAQIIAQTIPRFKVGDDIKVLKNALPGYFDHIQDGKGNMMGSMEGFAFVLQVNCGKIIRLEYGKSSSDFDSTIYGKLQEQPCP